MDFRGGRVVGLFNFCVTCILKSHVNIIMDFINNVGLAIGDLMILGMQDFDFA